MMTMGRALQRQGHRITVFQLSEMRARIEAEQLEFKPLGENSLDAGRIAQAVAEIGRRSGLSALRYTLDCGRRLAALICEHGPEAVRAAAVDLLLVDDNEPAGGAVAERLGLPYVNLVTLVELKLAARRWQDFADVVALIRGNDLDEEFAKRLHRSVRRDYLGCLDEALEEKRREEKYEAQE